MIKPIACVILALASLSAQAVEINTTFYSKINITSNQIEGGDSNWKSNNSNFGLKGRYALTDSVDIVFQLEQGIDVVHGGTHKDTLLNTRNSYFGFKGKYGQIVFGTHDSPLKKAQGKIDQFNNLSADIKQLFVGEVRSRDAFLYNSHKIGSGFKFVAMYVPADNDFDNSQSFTCSYKKDGLYAALSFDSGMRKNDKSVAKTKVYDTVRAALGYQFGNLKLGGIYQVSERTNKAGSDQEKAVMLSAAYKYNAFTFRGQVGQSDITASDRESMAFGVDYKFSKKLKLFVNYLDQSDDSSDKSTLEIGAQLKI